MKGVLRRKILRMVGIAFAIVFGFSGAVIGVMAAMGKFKTPTVYPTNLEFEIAEQIVVEGKTFNPEIDWEVQFEDEDNRPKIESFVLRGTNSKYDHEVNRKKCELWFTEGSDLITLCDEDGHPLIPGGNNGRYLVNCNEPIYYMINEVDSDEVTDGKVVLEARSTNQTLKHPESPMTLWIDRKVENVFVDYEQSDIDERKLTQEICLGIDMSLDFKYEINTPLSLKPISKESAKEIELYYNVEGMNYGTDYVRVTKAEVDKEDSPLHSVLTYDSEGVFKFKTNSLTPKIHTFYVAIFPTYADKTNYENFIIDNPITNFDKLTKSSEDDSVYMTVTTLKIVVEDIEISKAGLTGESVQLDLYSETSILIDDNDATNNLGLYMKKGEGTAQVDDYTRFSEVEFTKFNNAISVNDARFVDEGGNQLLMDDPEFVADDLRIELSGVKIAENLEIINYVTYGETTYYCGNGAAVLDSSDNSIKLLKTGSYLSFYIYNNGVYVPATFQYTSETVGNGRDRQWNITPTTMQSLNQGESLRVGLLVVNNTGVFKLGNYFASIPVTLTKKPLSAQFKDDLDDVPNVDFKASTKKATLDITFDYNGEDITNYPVLNYDGIITTTGSYREFVFVVEKSANCFLETVPDIEYSVGEKTYVIVGYYDSDSGEFFNEVRIKSDATISYDNQSCSIYMLQLRHAYEESANNVIKTVIQNTGDVALVDVVESLIADPVIINVRYILNKNLLSYYYGDPETTQANQESVSVYENISGKTITIRSDHSTMLEKVLTYNNYMIEIDCTEEYRSRIEITDVAISENDLIISYNVKEGNGIKIDLWIAIGGVQFDLGSVIILDGSPESIVLKYDSVKDPITLYTKADEALADTTNYITAYLEYESDAFVYRFEVNGEEVDYTRIFNAKISSDYGFKDGSEENKQQYYDVTYSVKDNVLFDTSKIVINGENVLLDSGLILAHGETVLQVTIDGVIGFIKLKTDTSKFSLATKEDNSTNFVSTKPVASLTEYFNYKYDGTAIAPSSDNMVEITKVKCVEYGDGALEVDYDEENNIWYLKKNLSDEDDKAILKIESTETGWVFTKSNYYVTLIIAFSIQTVDPVFVEEQGEEVFTLEFSSSIAIGVSKRWEEVDRTIYSGTTVLVVGDENQDPMFEVKKADGVDDDVFFKIKNGSELGTTFKPEDDKIGNITIVPVIGTTEIDQEFTFIVKPNVVVGLKLTELTSDSEYTIDGDGGVYTLNSFKTTNDDSTVKVYGSEGVFYNKRVYYTDASKETITEEVTEYFEIVADNLDNVDNTAKENLTFKVKNANDELSTTEQNKKLKTGFMKQLDGTVKREVSLLYRGIEVRKDSFVIKNKYSAAIDYTKDEGDGSVLTFKALKEYEIFAQIDDYALESIVIEGYDVVVEGNEFIITSIVNEKLEDVEAKLTFKKSETEILECVCSITLLPYTPNIKEGIKEPFAGMIYDLINDVYDFESSLVGDTNITSLIVTGIKLEPSIQAENKAEELVEDWPEGGSGYVYGVDGPHCSLKFKDISGDLLMVYAEYTITYSNGKTYVYYVELPFENRLSISVQYPEETIHSNGTYKFLEGCEEDALNLSGLSEVSGNGIYELKNLPYEAVLVYTNTQTTINFTNDEIKKINRVVVEDAVVLSNVVSQNVKIKLVAYQNNGGMYDYVNRLSRLTHSNNVVTLPSAQQGVFGTLIFKLTTESGNFKYYNIYIYCKDSNATANVNTENNMEIYAYTNSTRLDSKDLIEKAITSTTTYLDLISFVESDFYSCFKTGYNNGNAFDVYLYEIVSIGGEVSRPYTKVSEDDQIKVNEYFNTITLGLVMNDGVQMYCFGTITIYVQPTIDISTTANYVLANGYFTDVVDAAATSVSCPFGEGWTVALISTDDDIYSVDEDGTTILLNKRVAEDTEIKVSYTHTNGTVAIVTYTYKATRIPEVENQVVTIGEFISEDEGFTKEINILSTTEYQYGVKNKDYFFGSYSGNFEVEVVGTFTNIVIDDEVQTSGKITFTQTNVEQNCKIKITYEDLDSNDNTREFAFKILAGVHFVTDSETHGLTSSNRLTTSKSNSYSSMTGSTLSFYKFELKDDEENTIGYKYVVGGTFDDNTQTVSGGTGLSIYTNVDSSLVLTFDKSSFVLKDTTIVLGSAEEITINANNQSVGFVHSAQDEQNITMVISVENSSGEQFAERNIYLNVAKTYTTLLPVYLAEGADHQNVVSGSSIGDETDTLHDHLLEKGYIKMLVDTEVDEEATTDFDYYQFDNNLKTYVKKTLTTGSNVEDYVKSPKTFDLLAMGLATSSNPNCVSLEVDANATLKTIPATSSIYIQFNSVDRNCYSRVFLKNEAGISYGMVVYNYQIMNSTTIDGLDYSESDGYCGTYQTTDAEPVTVPYVSFILEDRDHTKTYLKRFVLGKMKDEKNNSIFSVGGSWEPSATLVGGYSEDAIQYQLGDDDSNYILYLTLDLGYVELCVARNKTEETAVATSDIIQANISIGGVNGAGTIESNLTIVLNNDHIQEKHVDERDGEIYAGFKINLFADTDSDGVYDDGKFIENNGVDVDADTDGYQTALTYTLAESSYLMNGTTYKINAGQDNNNLFKYNPETKEIQTNAVASDVDADIIFLVKSYDSTYNIYYVVRTITYKLTIYLNMKFVVNGDETSALETDFVLTNKATSSGEYGEFFSLIKNFKDGDEIETSDIVVKPKSTYYKVLSYDLYRLQSQNNQLIMGKESVKITLNSAIDPDIMKVTNEGIEFFKDYSGEIELKLSVQTKNGIYSRVWTIYVTPILDIDLARTNKAILQTSASSAFSSGTKVELISDITKKTNEGVGVTVGRDPNFENYVTHKYQEDDDRDGIPEGTTVDTVSVSYSYKIYRFVANSGISSKTSAEIYSINEDTTSKLYEEFGEYYIASSSGSGSLTIGNVFEVTLPRVPSSSDVQSYLVVYKVYLEYLELTNDEDEVEVFYVTYNVINKQQVNKHSYQLTAGGDYKASEDVEVDDRVYAKDAHNYLDLLYYIEEETKDSTTYSLIYSGSDIVLNVTPNGGTATTYTAEENLVNNELKLIYSSDYFMFNPSSHELKDKDNEIIGKLEPITYYREITSTTPSKNYLSVFNSEFRTILEYKEFIDLYANKKSVRFGDQRFVQKPEESITAGTTPVTGLYTLDSGKYSLITDTSAKAEDGVDYYIDIATFTLTKIENSRYGIDLSEHGVSIFNNELNESLNLIIDGVNIVTIDGFRLRAKNSIAPKGNVYTIDQMGLSNYFTPNDDWNSNVKIIGFGTPSDEAESYWVSNATDVDIDDETIYGTVSISNGTSNNTYSIKKAVYSSGEDESTAYYTISQEYYYIVGSEGLDLVVPNYTGVETYLYSIAYNPNNEGNVALNLETAVLVWEMVDCKLQNVSSSKVYSTFSVTDVEDETLTETTVSTLIGTVSGYACTEQHTHTDDCDESIKKLTLSANVLSEYKLENPSAYSYPTIHSTIVVDDTTIELVIEFVLPDEKPQFFEAYNGTTDVTISLSESVSEVVTNADNEKYYKVPSEGGNVSNLLLNGTEINNFFTTNTTATKLVLEYEIKIGEELKSIEVVIYKSAT